MMIIPNMVFMVFTKYFHVLSHLVSPLLTFIESLLYTRYIAKHFTNFILFNP